MSKEQVVKMIKDAIEKKERFYALKEDKWGNVDIMDVLNTEPVCRIFSGYHPYAVKVIKEALKKFEEENKTMEKYLKFLIEET